MHLRQTERNIHLRIAAKLYKLINSGLIFEVSKPVANKTPSGLNARGSLHIVIGAKIVFAEQQVHLPASCAAKCVVVFYNELFTRLATMVATIGAVIVFFDKGILWQK